jgi:hypothetical protein
VARCRPCHRLFDARWRKAQAQALSATESAEPESPRGTDTPQASEAKSGGQA